MQLALKEQEKSSSGPAPSSLRPRRPSSEPSHPRVDQEHDRVGASNGRSEELERGSPLGSQDKGEESQELEQQEVAVEEEGGGGGNGEERGRRGEKQRHQDEAKEISSGNHYPRGSDRGYDTNDKDNEDPRPAKLRKPPPRTYRQRSDTTR
jgi:hypothetical protein